MKAFTFILSFFLSGTCLFATGKPVKLKAGMTITKSVVIEKALFTIKADTGFLKPIITIQGNNIIVDFAHAILQGTVDKTKPDEFYGLAILISKGSRNVTIRNANIHGYKIAIMADSVENLRIEHCNVSYNWRQRLHSGREREDVSDWMSFHQNEKDEWLRYGAAIYLKNCTKAIIAENIVTGGQCALLMTRCSNSEIYNNNFSFNSAIGIGMYRSSYNRIYHNRLDWNVRGYSHGKFHRGQDSAGILVFEQCNNNTFAFNSATHSGDGFFLWAGQTTMDSGSGGCNDNLIYGNDFSYAPTNGVEVTFSRNIIEQNIIKACDHGIWGGYSYDTYIVKNQFADNRIGIAIEHGQDNEIIKNLFYRDKTAIKLWSRAQQPDDWIYAQKRDTRSKNYKIIGNDFRQNEIVYDMMGTDSIKLTGNVKQDFKHAFKNGGRLFNVDSSDENLNVNVEGKNYQVLSSLKYKTSPSLHYPAGRNQIRITDWGPYNFTYPILWLTDVDSLGLYYFDILGPAGTWNIKNSSGFKMVSKGKSTTPSTLVLKADDSEQNRSIRLKYKGKAFKDAFGINYSSMQPYPFGYAEFIPNAKWNVSWYKWNNSSDPNKDYKSFYQLLQKDHLYSDTVSSINFTWWGAIGKNLPADTFATVAHTTIKVDRGMYELGVTADDLVKVIVDGKEVINVWNAAEIKYDEFMHHSVKLKLGGEHDIKIIHVENAGFATLMFYLKPMMQ